MKHTFLWIALLGSNATFAQYTAADFEHETPPSSGQAVSTIVIPAVVASAEDTRLTGVKSSYYTLSPEDVETIASVRSPESKVTTNCD